MPPAERNGAETFASRLISKSTDMDASFPTDYERGWEAKCLPVVLWPLGLLCRLGSGECGSCDAVVSIIEERQPPSPRLLCGSEAAFCGWKRLMKSTRESVRVSTSQQCNSTGSPCTCSEAPLLSCSGWRSLNDLQISLFFFFFSKDPDPSGPLLEGGRFLLLWLPFYTASLPAHGNDRRVNSLFRPLGRHVLSGFGFMVETSAGSCS